jgi:dTDP-4-amino-4,6-dideoxygalactose transaminase
VDTVGEGSAVVNVPFNRPYATGAEAAYIAEAIGSGHLEGDGPFTARCSSWLEGYTGSKRALLTQSCTAALELSALLCDLTPGDEVILPSFTFTSTANAFVLRGAVPVFVDIRPDTLNIDEQLIEAAITPRTRAIVVVHYAGVACEMDAILDIAMRHDLLVIEDAAQGVMAAYRGRPLGGIGHLGCFSFHATKNIVSGEGGSLQINDDRYVRRAEIIREKGTNRSEFLRGQVDKYTWVDVGSSLLPSELTGAFLWAQLEHADEITARRLALWEAYHAAFAELESEGLLRRPIVPDHCSHNAHLYYLLLPSPEQRTAFIAGLRRLGIQAVFHYVPLHSAPLGLRVGRVAGPMVNTDSLSERLVRLPLWVGLEHVQDEVIGRALEQLAHVDRFRPDPSR